MAPPKPPMTPMVLHQIGEIGVIVRVLTAFLRLSRIPSARGDGEGRGPAPAFPIHWTNRKCAGSDAHLFKADAIRSAGAPAGVHGAIFGPNADRTRADLDVRTVGDHAKARTRRGRWQKGGRGHEEKQRPDQDGRAHRIYTFQPKVINLARAL
jgi:hypothetical protein